ncbi:MAG: serine/threonine-protein kinase [Planctomycetaceae bacterium]
MTERRIGPFIIGRQLGAGGMGVVYRATYTETGRDVALKVLPPGLIGDDKIRARFEREIGILKKLSHPNIVRYYGGGTHEGQRWYAMELIDGGAVSQLLKRRGRLTPEQAIEAGRQLCAALEHAHNAGIIHRDLKPGNLFISSKGRIKLGDFGIARDTEASPLTAVGKTVGTYAYMAPEQIRGSAVITRKTDLYAVGCLLYELLTGQTPFLADNPAEMLLAHLESEPFPVRSRCPTCPPALDQLILRLLEKEPDDRPFDALAVHTELTEIAAALKASPEASGNGSTTSSTVSMTAIPGTGRAAGGKKAKKKKKREWVPFYERTWFLVCSLIGLVALASILWSWNHLSDQETYDVCFQTVQSALRNTLDTPMSKLSATVEKLQNLLDKESLNAGIQARTKALFDEARSLTLELNLESCLKGRKRIRNAMQKTAVEAFRAEQDEATNPLIAIDLLQLLVESTETAAAQSSPAEEPQTSEVSDVSTGGMTTDKTDKYVHEPRLWNQVARRRLSAARDRFLKRQDPQQLSEEYIAQLSGDLDGDNAEDSRRKLGRFLRVFEDSPSASAACERARRLLGGEQTSVPAEPRP